jgi:acyl-CoA reductase-like NAD-dependent aldehyde dehydrogenase
METYADALPETLPLWLAGRPMPVEADVPVLKVRDKTSGQVATRVRRAGPAEVEAAIAAAYAARSACAAVPAWRRARALNHVAQRLEAQAERFARVLVVEAGKPIRDARGEVGRALDTLRVAAQEATRLEGSYHPLDIAQRSEGYRSVTQRVPVGAVALITPFNFPLNLAAHKVGPAVAAGCPFVLKPASHTPVTALLLGALFAETDLPPGAFSVLPCSPADVTPLVEDPRIALLSFTGSPQVGWDLKARCGRKKVALELGGNAGCIVDAGADLDRVVDRLIMGAFYQSGQSCISVQRLLVHTSLHAALRTRLVEAAAALKAGDPHAEDTFLGPLITEAEAIRVERWVDEAVALGARVLCGGRRDGAFYAATVLENVPRNASVSCKEVFGPVVTLEPFDDFRAAVDVVNDSDFGLQAGVFTPDLGNALYAWDHLEVGGVIIDDVPSFRVDSMPYGGVKDSGLGREGVRFALEEMTELRLLVLRSPAAR